MRRLTDFFRILMLLQFLYVHTHIETTRGIFEARGYPLVIHKLRQIKNLPEELGGNEQREKETEYREIGARFYQFQTRDCTHYAIVGDRYVNLVWIDGELLYVRKVIPYVQEGEIVLVNIINAIIALMAGEKSIVRFLALGYIPCPLVWWTCLGITVPLSAWLFSHWGLGVAMGGIMWIVLQGVQACALCLDKLPGSEGFLGKALQVIVIAAFVPVITFVFLLLITIAAGLLM